DSGLSGARSRAPTGQRPAWEWARSVARYYRRPPMARRRVHPVGSLPDQLPREDRYFRRRSTDQPGAVASDAAYPMVLVAADPDQPGDGHNSSISAAGVVPSAEVARLDLTRTLRTVPAGRERLEAIEGCPAGRGHRLLRPPGPAVTG